LVIQFPPSDIYPFVNTGNIGGNSSSGYLALPGVVAVGNNCNVRPPPQKDLLPYNSIKVPWFNFDVPQEGSGKGICDRRGG
jgi:hypothetical protein